MAELSEVVADGNILRLVEKFLRAGVMEGGKFQPTQVGTPQGGVASPLLANIALNVLDWHLHELGYQFVRYADDFVVLCRSEHEAKEALAMVQQLLEDRLGLSLSPEKTKVTRFHEGFTFLGFDIKSRFVRMRAKSVENFKTKVRKLTRRSHNLDADGDRGTEPRDPRHGELLRHALVPLRRCIPQPGPLDTHATAVHEIQTEIGAGQLPPPFEALPAHGLTFPERPPTLLRSRIGPAPQSSGRFPRDRPVREIRTPVNMRN